MSREMTDVLSILEGLPLAVRTVRVARRLSLREAAKEIGISFNTLTRLENNAADVRLSNVIAALRWLGGEPQ